MSVNRKSQGQYNAYVLAGHDKKERSKRLLEAPEEMRNDIRIHVNTAITIRNRKEM